MRRLVMINGFCGAIIGGGMVALIIDKHPVLGIGIFLAFLAAIVNSLIP